MPPIARRGSPCCQACAQRMRTGQGVSASADVSALIAQGLSDYGVSSDSIQAALSGYANLSGNATDALMGLVDGGPGGADALSPVVAMGLGALGVGPVGIAAVSVALPILSAIQGLFLPTPPHCTWTVGNACFQTPVRPYGPSAPDGTPNPDWLTFDGLYTTDADLLVTAFPETLQLVCEVGAEGAADGVIPVDPGRRTAVESFLYAFDVAYEANAEYWLNGFQGLSAGDLLGIVVNAWNLAHDRSSTYTFFATPPDPLTSHLLTVYGVPGFAHVAWNPFGGMSCPLPMGDLNQGARSLVGMIVAGAVGSPGGDTPTAVPPVTIHTGERKTSGATLASLPSAVLAKLAGELHLNAPSGGSPEFAKGMVGLVAAKNSVATAALHSIARSATEGDAASRAAMRELGAAEEALLKTAGFWEGYYRLPASRRQDPFRNVSTASLGKVQAVKGHAWARAHRIGGLVT